MHVLVGVIAFGEFAALGQNPLFDEHIAGRLRWIWRLSDALLNRFRSTSQLRSRIWRTQINLGNYDCYSFALCQRRHG